MVFSEVRMSLMLVSVSLGCRMSDSAKPARWRRKVAEVSVSVGGMGVWRRVSGWFWCSLANRPSGQVEPR